MAKVAAPKKLNPNVRHARIQSRVNTIEMQEIMTKCLMYADGDMSVYLRMSALGYRPLKRVKVGK